jgi:hypothetical protein
MKHPQGMRPVSDSGLAGRGGHDRVSWCGADTGLVGGHVGQVTPSPLLCLPDETSSLRDISGTPSPDMVFLSLGSSSGQLDDLASGASGLPRQQVPIPFQALPPPLSSHDRLLDGSTGEGGVLGRSGCTWSHGVLVLSAVGPGSCCSLSSFFLSRPTLTLSVPSSVGATARCCPQHVPGNWGLAVLDNCTL